MRVCVWHFLCMMCTHRNSYVSAAFRCWDCSRQTTFKVFKESKAKATMNSRQSWLLSCCVSEENCRRCMYRYAWATRTLRAVAALLALHAVELVSFHVLKAAGGTSSFSLKSTLV